MLSGRSAPLDNAFWKPALRCIDARLVYRPIQERDPEFSLV
jgi:hypothetical protein